MCRGRKQIVSLHSTSVNVCWASSIASSTCNSALMLWTRCSRWANWASFNIWLLPKMYGATSAHHLPADTQLPTLQCLRDGRQTWHIFESAIQGTTECFQALDFRSTQQHQWKHRLVMPQWLIEIDPLATTFTVRCAGNRGKFGEHEPQPEAMGKMHRGL